MAEHQTSVPELEPLGHPAFPVLAQALRARKDRILQRWEETLRKVQPKLDKLTYEQVRDHIPQIVDRIIDQLEQGQPNVLHTFAESGIELGRTRFQQGYDHEGLIVEYRLLRRIIKEEAIEELGSECTFEMLLALDVGMDLSLQSAVITFTNYLADQLRAAAASESRHLAFLSHDLRNHLNTVVLVLQSLSLRLHETPGFNEETQDIDSAQHSIVQTLQGMERLIQLDRLRSGSHGMQVSKVNLRQLADEVIAQVLPSVQAKGLSTEVQIPAQAEVSTDRQLLSLAVYNIANNAVKYSTSGTIHIDARLQRENDKEDWQLAISDQGPGIAQDRVRMLFGAFARGDTHGQPGVGLGLTIASQAVNAIGGKINVESQVGSGSTFYLTIPNQ